MSTRRRATWFLGALFAVLAVLAMHGLDQGVTALHASAPASASAEHADCEDCPHGGHLVVLCAAIITVCSITVARNRPLRRSITRIGARAGALASTLTAARSGPPKPRPPAWVRLEVVLC